jgi:hypothetical protein
VAGAADERRGGGKLLVRAKRIRTRSTHTDGNLRATVMQTRDGELVGEFVVGVENETRVKLGGNGPEPRGETITRPTRLAHMVMREAGGEETRKRGVFALVVVFGGDEEEFH